MALDRGIAKLVGKGAKSLLTMDLRFDACFAVGPRPPTTQQAGTRLDSAGTEHHLAATHLPLRGVGACFTRGIAALRPACYPVGYEAISHYRRHFGVVGVYSIPPDPDFARGDRAAGRGLPGHG